MSKYKQYSEEFKQDVLGMVSEGKRSVAEIERELGLTIGIVYKWQQRYQVKDSQLQMSAERTEQAELRRLKRELEIGREERDILKKALQVFSRGELR